jgi:hypothetical protein
VQTPKALHLQKGKEEPTKMADQEVLVKDFSKLIGCLMIFDGAEAYNDKCCLKAADWEVHVAKSAIPQNRPSHATAKHSSGDDVASNLAQHVTGSPIPYRSTPPGPQRSKQFTGAGAASSQASLHPLVRGSPRYHLRPRRISTIGTGSSCH